MTSPLRERAASTELVERLCRSSERGYRNPYEIVDWPDRVDPVRDWFTSPERVTLHGTDLWDALDEPARRRVAFFEAVNFYSLNIHGEKALMEGLARRLYRPDMADWAPYLHHFLDEENKHSVLFGGFCARYAGGPYPDRTVVFARDHAPGEEDFLFFAKVLVFEEIVDRYNVAMGRDDRLHHVARRINQNHHAEETRHLLFGRHVVEELFARGRERWSQETLDDVRAHLCQFVVATWGEFYNPDAYRDAGLVDHRTIRREAWAHPEQRAHRCALSAKVLGWLRDTGILIEGPAL